MPASTDFLFHYATLPAVHGIATTKRLWATNIGHLADATEFSYAHEMLRDALVHASRGQPADISAAVDVLVNDIASAQKGKNLVFGSSLAARYITSFSENGDQLSQWRAYCPGGGYALGFRIDALRTIAGDQGFDLVQCSYDSARHKLEARDLAHAVMTKIEAIPHPVRASLLTADNDELNVPLMQDLFAIRRYLLDQIQMLAPAWKHLSFREEAEWRLVSRSKERTAKFRVGRTALVPYVEIELDGPATKINDLVAVIGQTYVGPCPEPELAVGSLQLLFEVENIACPQYTLSSTPYRQW